MTPAIASYYSIAIFFAIAAGMAIPLYLRGSRRGVGTSVADVLPDSPTHQAAACQTRRLVALSGTAGLQAARIKSLARQAAPSRARAVHGDMPNTSPVSHSPTLSLLARRPGLPRGTVRVERRLAVVR
jgi:hypothetical protein